MVFTIVTVFIKPSRNKICSRRILCNYDYFMYGLTEDSEILLLASRQKTIFQRAFPCVFEVCQHKGGVTNVSSFGSKL